MTARGRGGWGSKRQRQRAHWLFPAAARRCRGCRRCPRLILKAGKQLFIALSFCFSSPGRSFPTEFFPTIGYFSTSRGTRRSSSFTELENPWRTRRRCGRGGPGRRRRALRIKGGPFFYLFRLLRREIVRARTSAPLPPLTAARRPFLPPPTREIVTSLLCQPQPLHFSSSSFSKNKRD